MINLTHEMDHKQDSNIATQQFSDIVMAQDWAERQKWRSDADSKLRSVFKGRHSMKKYEICILLTCVYSVMKNNKSKQLCPAQ